MRKLLCIAISLIIFVSANVYADNPQLEINSKSAILMEYSTGEILYEMNPDEKLPIASVTKIMTMLLIAEALDSGTIKLDDLVSVSERAMSMGGSTMFLETGERITVDEMLKGIAVASANDGTVAMAEFLAGSESEFVARMNEKAKELGMNNTNFVNTNGLDAEGHYSSARDVALMSRELLKHELIFNYTTIWTDTMRGGKYELANTNKLIRFYDGANGLKTGSTDEALCCLSASAKRDGMQLIAVVLGAPNSNERFGGARTLLDYGFSAYSIKETVPANTELGRCSVKCGVEKDTGAAVRDAQTMLMPKSDKSEITYKLEFSPDLKAPVYEGDTVGEAVILKNEEEIKRVPVYATETVEKKTFIIALKELARIICSK